MKMVMQISVFSIGLENLIDSVNEVLKKSSLLIDT